MGKLGQVYGVDLVIFLDGNLGKDYKWCRKPENFIPCAAIPNNHRRNRKTSYRKRVYITENLCFSHFFSPFPPIKRAQTPSASSHLKPRCENELSASCGGKETVRE